MKQKHKLGLAVPPDPAPFWPSADVLGLAWAEHAASDQAIVS